MCQGAGADAGDTVQLAILGPEPEAKVPADLRVALGASDEAKALWSDLTPMGRRDWIRWIDAAKKPQTRARRITRTVEQLSSGKRRPCCVNVYEFMLCRIDEDEQAQ
ncbi:MAG: YdeI/OmpD-associated family protein [Sedimentisphaerales bacterium]|nr:YdeI/OmpD-associated family protein [Sedimentisphaerales bacterium]